MHDVQELGARARAEPPHRREHVATNFAFGEEAVGAIFDCKMSKRKEDAPAEGSSSKTKTLAKKQKQGKKGKKSAPQN